MGDENHIRTLEDYSKLSHEGYRNTIELPVGNNVYCMKDHGQSFVEYTSSRTDEVGGKWYTFKPKQNNFGDTYNPSWKNHSNLRFSQVVIGKPCVEISNMTHDPLEDLEKEHTKSVYPMNEEDKRRGVEYVMNKILGFYKECLELGPEYVTGKDDEGEVTFLALGWRLAEIHMTWAHLEKKRTRLRTCTKIRQEILFSKHGDGVVSIKRRRRDLSGDGV
nr:hypothetical protein [Tanacetum cinerariifolium]